MDQAKLASIIAEARSSAVGAASAFKRDNLGGKDRGACGFAWVCITKDPDGKRITGNTKMGRLLKAVGVTQNYDRSFQIWNPAGSTGQNVDMLLEGARSAVRVLKSYGFDAYASSRLD